MKTFNTTLFSDDLKQLRKKSNKSQITFSKELEINRSTLSLLENGKQLPDLEILNKICTLTSKKPSDYFIDNQNDGLIYLMGSLEENDKVKIEELIEKIKLKEKYEILARRCFNDIN